MTQKILMKTLSLVLLLALGAVWPWTLATADQTLYVNLLFPDANSKQYICFTSFTCSGDCTGAAQIVTLQSPLQCYQQADHTKSCTAPCTLCNALYDPSTNKLLRNVNFPGGCGCPTINTNPAYRCISSPVFPIGVGTGTTVISNQSESGNE